MAEEKKQLKNIVEKNSDLQERIQKENWGTRYNRASDMIVMGTQFPAGSFYVYVNGSGVMIRVDDSYKIYGFAIENAKAFVRKNQEIGVLFYPMVFPIRFFWMYWTWRGMNKMKRIMSVSDYIAGEVCYT